MAIRANKADLYNIYPFTENKIQRRSGISGLLSGSLELVKEGNLSIKQNKLFEEIYIKENNE